jgi:heme ABC exporter ATP-binding subunit CcmA
MSGEGAPDAVCDFEVVATDGVSRHYGRRAALIRVSFECRAGSIVGLLGPNGAGKSTLLGILATLVAPTAGLVRYGDRPARAWGDAIRGQIGVLGHEPYLYDDLTAAENLDFFCRLYALENRQERIDGALEHARMASRAGERVGAFSRGLRQRLALERALLHGPRLVLLDEPFTGLDDASIRVLVNRLRALRERGAIVIMATHDFDSADEVIDRALCLQAGRLIPIDPGAGRLRDRYRRAIEGAVL